jgi:RNA polymerase sigma-70 factor (ECF subfamily)
MANSGSQTTELQAWLDQLRAGNPAARAEVISRSCERLRQLAHRMLKNYPRLRRWEQTDDVLQNAMLRLHRSLAEVKPESVAQFLGFAAAQVRRTLLDLLRHHFGPEGAAAHHHTDGKGAANDLPSAAERCEVVSAEPEDLEAWTRFHETVDALPDEQRQVFNLLWYEALSQPQAASVLGVSQRTVGRRWLAARCAIFEALDGKSPE